MSKKGPPVGSLGAALRELRKASGIKTQTAASQRPGAPDFRTLSHWETGRKDPSLPLLMGYLAALGFDFYDLQDAIDQVDEADGSAESRLRELGGQVDRLARVAEDLAERRLPVLERRSGIMGDEIRTMAEWADEIAGKLERLTDRITALEGHFSPSWTELGDTPVVPVE